ncbi:MAG: hypothetical protein LBT32_05190 [Peptococcaceae bacterium]|nr:hypothetical protein [Peptococcaceae bacterium]
MIRFINRNLAFKLFSVLIAVLLWLWVANQGAKQEVSDNSLTIPLYAQSMPANIVVMDKLPSVRVRLLGVNPSISTKDLYAYLDLSLSVVGKQTFQVKVDEIPGVQIMEISPKEVTLTLDQVQEKIVPVIVHITGEPNNMYEMGQALVRPSAVNVRGPSSLLETLERVTAEISVADAQDTVSVSRPISLLDKDGKPMTGPDALLTVFNVSPQSVDVVVPILPKGLASKKIPVRITAAGTLAEGYVLRSLVPYPESILVYGREENLWQITTVNPPPVDVSALSEDQVIPVELDKVRLPNGVTLAPGATLSVVISVGPAVGQRSVSVPVTLHNLANHLELSEPMAQAEIVIRGYPELINALEEKDILVWIDADEMRAGAYAEVELNWQLPPGVEMVSAPKATVRLRDNR